MIQRNIKICVKDMNMILRNKMRNRYTNFKNILRAKF